MKKLDIKQAEPIRAKFTPDWEIRKGKYLYKKVAFDDYNQALEFLQMIKDPQIELDHFADIGIFYNELILMVYTHDVGGLTQLDFELALHIDEHLGHLDARTLDEGQAINNPKNTFLTKSDTAYDFLRVGKTISNLSTAKKSDNRDEPDVMIVPFGGKKEKDHLKKGLKKSGYKTQDADKPGDDAHVDENFAKDSMTSIKLIKKYQQTGKDEDAFAAIKHGWNFIKNPKMRSIIVNLVKKVSTENGYPEWNDTVAYIKKNTGIDVSNVNENFADGKKKGKSRPGRVKRSGASCNGSVTALRKRAKNASGEKAKMYHWCANMKSGRKKK